MSKVYIQKNNFTSGVLSPELFGRSDIGQYQNGLKKLHNFIPLPQGGIRKRFGTQYLTTMTIDYQKLITFVDKRSNPWLIFLDSSVLSIMNGVTGELIQTMSHSFGEAASSLSTAQSGDILWIATGNHPVYWLRTNKTGNWSLDEFPVDKPPSAEIQQTPEQNLTPTIITGSPSDVKGTNAGEVIHLVSDASIWTSADVGKFVEINGGLCEIIEYVDAQTVKAHILSSLTALVTAIPKSWVLKEPVWSNELGYPKCVSYHKQRLMFANTDEFPNTVWASRIGDIRNFVATTQDNDGFSLEVSPQKQSPILHLADSYDFIVMTAQEEYRLHSGDAPLTPRTVRIDKQTNHGTIKACDPEQVGSELIHADHTGKRLRALSYNYETFGLISRDLMAIASHVLGGEKILKATFQQSPEKLIWVRSENHVASLSLDREQNVIAWATHDFSGKVENIEVVRMPTGEEKAYFVIRRGSSVTVNVLNPDIRTDSSVIKEVQNSRVSLSVVEQSMLYFAAENHDAEIVGYIGNRKIPFVFDGRYGSEAEYDITGGVVNDGEKVTIGLSVKASAQPLPPELSQSPSTTNHSKGKIDSGYLRILDSLGGSLNGDDIYIQNLYEDAVFNNPSLLTGKYEIEQLGWDDMDGIKVEITHDEPLPFYVLAISYGMSVNR